nr:hypothetical protein [Burkholderiaceae bacterium]
MSANPLVSPMALLAPLRAAPDSPGSAPGLDVAARRLPVPDTVSPEMQKLIAAPLRAGWGRLPKTGDEWRSVAEAGAAVARRSLPGLLERMQVTVEKTTAHG